MDLHDGRITVKQVMRVPGAMEILRDELPQYINSPLMQMAGNMSLRQVISMARGKVPQSTVNRIWRRLIEL